MKQNIQNIIFDLGGVLLNINYQNTIQAFHRLGIPNFENIFSQYLQNTISQQFEKGLITDVEFRNALRSLSRVQLSDTDIDQAWNALLLDFPVQRFYMLQSLRKRYRLYLLSNTNIIHYRVYQQLISNTFSVESLDALFSRAYYSHEIQMRKPDAAIFQFVLQENNLIPAQTLFIDDSIQHIEAANKLSIITHHLKQTEEISTRLPSLLCS